MRAAIVALALALVAGCAKQGTELTTWTLETRGTTTPIALPGKLTTVGDMAFTLTADVELASTQRGTALTLVLDCYHGALSATAGGIALADDGDGASGSWRFDVPATATAGERVTLTLAGKGGAMTIVGFGAAPRLVDDPRGDPRARAVAGINRYSALASLMLIGFLFVPYLTMYVLDRRRREYPAILAYGVTLTNTPLALLGVFGALGPAGSQIGLLMGAGNYATLLLTIHYVFELEPVKRFWWYLIGGYAALVAGSIATPALVEVAIRLNGPMTLVVNAYSLWRLVRLARGGPHAFDARLILAGSLINAVILVQGVMWVVSGTSPLGGVHPMPLGICLSMLIQTVVLARQHVARQRAIAEANAELQRQVAERSRELGEAVAQLTTRPIQLVDEKVVDDRYVIIGRLGAGRSATVHEVERISDGKRFAMKLLRERADARRTARFAREARGTADPPHPNLVPVIDVGIVDGVTFVVTPIVDGGSLLVHKGRFGDRAWAEWMLAQIATALAELHARGVLHRDLRAANVLVSAGQAKLVDAGLAALAALAGGTDDTVTANPAPGDAPTRPGHLRGAADRVAPELVRGEPATQASDVFALGVLAQQLFGDEPLPEVIARCLADDPAERPSAADVAVAFTARTA